MGKTHLRCQLGTARDVGEEGSGGGLVCEGGGPIGGRCLRPRVRASDLTHVERDLPPRESSRRELDKVTPERESMGLSGGIPSVRM